MCPGTTTTGKIFPGLAALRPLFMRPRSGRHFHGTSRLIFSPAAAVPFIRWVRAPEKPQFAPLRRLPAFHDLISPQLQRARYFKGEAPNFFLGCYAAIFFVANCAPATPKFDPLRELALLFPPLFSRLPQIFPRPLHGRFFPRSKVLRARWVFHP